MRNYLVEYEFKTNMSNRYWFPLFINAKNAKLAEISAKTVQTALEERYELIHRTEAKLVIEAINGEYLSEYIAKRLSVQMQFLDVNIWRFSELPSNPELNFNEHMKLIESVNKFTSRSIPTFISNNQFPVRLYSHSLLEAEEFLLVNVVNPTEY